jgi:hypothetical protein
MSGPKYNEEKQKKEEEYWCVEGSDDEKYDPSGCRDRMVVGITTTYVICAYYH